MNNMPIENFMIEHYACTIGRQWVKKMGFKTCKETFEALCDGRAGEYSYEWAMWSAAQPDVLDRRELVGFAAWCVRRVAHLLTDARSIKALELAERYAAGEDVTDRKLKMAAYAAYATYAAYAAYAAWVAVDAAFYAASAASAAARAAADPAAERRAQLEYLRKLVTFEKMEAAE